MKGTVNSAIRYKVGYTFNVSLALPQNNE